MCFTCLYNHDQAIGWFKGPIRQFIREKQTCNELDNRITLVDCDGYKSECKIVYKKKADEIKMPSLKQGEYHLLLAEFAIFELETNMIYFPLDPIEPCDKPDFPKVRLFEINDEIAQNYFMEKKLKAIDGTTYEPELDPETNEPDELALLVERYLNHFLSGGYVPRRTCRY